MLHKKSSFSKHWLYISSIFVIMSLLTMLLVLVELLPQPNEWHLLWRSIYLMLSLGSIATIIYSFKIFDKVYRSLENIYRDNLYKLDNNTFPEESISAMYIVSKLHKYIDIVTLESQILYDTALTIHTSSSLQELLDTVMARINTHLKGDFALVFLLEDNHLQLVASANVDEKFIYKTSFRMGEGLVGYAIQEGEAFLTEDVQKDKRYIKCVAGCKSQLTIPLKVYGEKLGVLVLGSYQSVHFEEKDLLLLKTMSSEIALAINNTKLTEELRKEKKRVDTLYETSQQIAASIQIDQVMEIGLKNLSHITDATSCSLMLFDEEDELLKIKASRGLSQETVANISFKVGEGIAGRAFQERTPLLVADVNEDRQFKIIPCQKEGFKSLYAIPLGSKKKCIGVINIATNQPLTQEKCNLVETLISQLSMSIKNALLHQSMQNLAIRDELTGLYNHRYFQQSLEKEIIRAKRYQRDLSLILIDIDNFKKHNDSYGHMVGDHILQTVSTMLQENIRDSDILARYGGDELVIILPETNIEMARSLMERLKDKVAKHSFNISSREVASTKETNPDEPTTASSFKNQLIDWLNKKSISFKNTFDQMPNQVTLSVGISSLRDLDEPVNKEMLMKRADKALLYAKEKGKNQVASWCDMQSK
ncbi:sensor domain-containing diguanylate cyclase [Clostridium formicaceticum]|uniref:Response regulator PleD n=1 Tax=Clostridium formicaceticum TaxID=1497 RepID=A0AAC9RLG1_9CLOT|nr:diguanylate cyclase [Clostridium formicaceticum]AOY74978.1 hypothetical protein BJL90_02785 [Clostridium formicaceticum]ARE89391.1 Response regulator PleD [Clostridium formicaceticum]